MTVQELIDILLKVEDKKTIVLTCGYENGYTEVSTSGIVSTFAKLKRHEWYEGEFEYFNEVAPGKSEYYIEGIVLLGDSRHQ